MPARPAGLRRKSATHRESIPPFAYASRNGLDQSVGAFFLGSGKPAGEERRCVPAGGA